MEFESVLRSAQRRVLIVSPFERPDYRLVSDFLRAGASAFLDSLEEAQEAERLGAGGLVLRGAESGGRLVRSTALSSCRKRTAA